MRELLTASSAHSVPSCLIVLLNDLTNTVWSALWSRVFEALTTRASIDIVILKCVLFKQHWQCGKRGKMIGHLKGSSSLWIKIP